MRERPGGGRARALAAIHTFFALAAGARAIVQLAVDPGRAPFAYALSAFAAVLYIVAAIALRRPGRRAWRTALVACTVELAGVLIVGAFTASDAARFGDETVWSAFGNGYGHLPLVLPLLGLAHLVAVRTRTPPAPTSADIQRGGDPPSLSHARHVERVRADR